MTRRALFALVGLLFVVTAAGAADTGTVSGKLTINGKAVSMSHAYARRDGDTVVVILSEKALAPEDLKDEFGMMKLRRKISAISLSFDKDKELTGTEIFSPDIEDTGSFGTSGTNTFEPTAFTRTRVAGRSYTGKEQEFFGLKWAYDVTFDVPVKK